MVQWIRTGVAIASVVATLSVTACAGAGQTGGPAEPVVMWALLDADSHGAVVLSVSEPSSRLFGVDRDGAPVWRAEEALARRTPTVVCANRCPVAIASPSLTDTSTWRPVEFGRPTGTALSPGRKTSVLSAGPLGVVQEVADDTGRSELTVPTADPARSTVVVGRGTLWRASNDGTVAVAMTTGQDGRGIDVRVFNATPDGWQPTGPVERTESLFGCSAAGGGHRIVSDPTPRMSTGQGVRTKIAGLEAGGDCGFLADGAVVAQYALSGSQRQTTLVTVDMSGTVRSTAEFALEARISTDVGGHGFVVVLDGYAEERDLSGRVLQTITDVADARYTKNGEIVSISASGDVRWTEGKSRRLPQ